MFTAVSNYLLLLTTLCERSGALASASSVFVFGYSKSLEVRAHNVSVRSRAARTHAGCGLASARWNKQESRREQKKDGGGDGGDWMAESRVFSHAKGTSTRRYHSSAVRR